ncbi:hypothetical protein CVT24_005088 [Panaeolus cyanescens]|uniref:F-box domain-containing protein n=1 Tax=Panaeolus cyanescens TaxID=181874 RepID=A0A409YAY7_9AGAR|nr:hypothetical protein CVT24_005088 [Panaeolus cyanescens]
MASALHGRTLFPNLQSLWWERPQDDCIPLLQLCITPRLKRLELRGDRYQELSASWNQGACSIVHQLADLAQQQLQLAELKLLDHFCVPAVLDVIPLSFPHLRTLHLTFDPLSDIGSHFDTIPVSKFLQSLADLSHLEELSLIAPLHLLHHQPDQPKLRFAQLKTLSIGCWFHETLQFLSMAQFPSLSSFSLDLVLSPHLGHDHDWNLLFEALSGCVAFSRLRELAIRPWEKQKGDDMWPEFMAAQQGVEFQDLAQYLVQMRLTRFDCPFPIFRSLGMDDLKSLSPNWKDIEVLTLYTADAAQLGVGALRYIATAFPKLRSLSVNLDVHGYIPKYTAGMEHPLDMMTLQLERFARRTVEVVEFVTYVDACFPNLTSITELRSGGWREVEQEYGRPGSVVSQVHQQVRFVRGRERERVVGGVSV